MSKIRALEFGTYLPSIVIGLIFLGAMSFIFYLTRQFVNEEKVAHKAVEDRLKQMQYRPSRLLIDTDDKGICSCKSSDIEEK